ncbi:protein phosphatase 2C domain-containing protein [Photobacterium galatheae]|uniref:PPM-type phosphatase domain-containing protein n=1 Tax=Photobacterium galatheae TaxID=1654360 RepID=A0A066RUW6_9GAMM|nr:protein phosphatase 2C domain-containing protein [Photobacterium galatheae]KDM92911.1 hypothetical protein EA58_03915 [Photobacterium galatheae]MCM0148124.1 protein phosphatase 2C domain-containing protein [Photobacterium galatheae]
MKVEDFQCDNVQNGTMLDRVGIGTNCMWVIDGASEVVKSDEDSKATWLIDTLNSELQHHSPGGIKQTLSDRMNYILSKYSLAQELSSRPKENQPCFTLAMLKKYGEKLEVGVIADASVILLMSDGEIKVITDKRINPFSDRTLSFRDKTKQKEQMIENRRFMNQQGGYWVGTSGLDWVPETKVSVFSVQDVEKVLLCSDGFTRVFQNGLVSYRSVLSGSVDIGEALELLREREKIHPLKEVKQHDDASAILISVK